MLSKHMTQQKKMMEDGIEWNTFIVRNERKVNQYAMI
jgi:hypothetical protein